MNRLVAIFLLAVLAAASAVPAQPVTSHPRLWVRQSDLARLRARAVATNPIYQDGLRPLALGAVGHFNANTIPAADPGNNAWSLHPSEKWAMLFAFMSLVENNPADRAAYAARARTLLMHVVDQVRGGPAANVPFRHPGFATGDRSRWWGHGFPLTVDWIYDSLSTTDKEYIREVFLRWCDQNLDGYNHPTPRLLEGNDPQLLLQDDIRIALNNYYTAHMRNIGMMALCLDAADDAPYPADANGKRLRDYLTNATGAWLFQHSHVINTDCQGGFDAEGVLYGPENSARVAHFYLALHTAGYDDPNLYSPAQPQVDWDNYPYISDSLYSFIHSLSPKRVPFPDPLLGYLGERYLPADYGDVINYWADDPIGLYGTKGWYNDLTGNTAELDLIRWFQLNVPGEGVGDLADRVNYTEDPTVAILYFLLFDPASMATIDDPRPDLPTDRYGEGIGRVLSRTGWDEDANWFAYKCGWLDIDHNSGDGNDFAFWRKGEWLTKKRSGYGNEYIVSTSEYHNTLSIENDPYIPAYPAWDWRTQAQVRGSQYYLENTGDGEILAHSFAQGYTYILGDATGLYNSYNQWITQDSTDVTHASRSIIWLKPDHIVILDRASTMTAGRFKRFWLNVPSAPVVSGTLSYTQTLGGQRLYINTLLPAGAAIAADTTGTGAGEDAAGNFIHARLSVQAPGNPASATFLHVLQGVDSGGTPDPATLVQSAAGTAYLGSAFADVAVLFPASIAASFASTTYTVPTAAATQYITGLVPNTDYLVTSTPAGPGQQEMAVAPAPGGGPNVFTADDGGVVVWTLPASGVSNWTLY